MIERAHERTRDDAAALFLLGCAATFLGTVSAAFSALMRLSLRLMAERSGRDDALGQYLDDPLRLFIPVALLHRRSCTVLAGVLHRARRPACDARVGCRVRRRRSSRSCSSASTCIPLLIVRRDPERVLDVLLPSFDALASVLRPLTIALLDRLGRRGASASVTRRQRRPADAAGDAGGPKSRPAEDDDLARRKARELLQSIVDFRETMVREVMTPRPDIVAIHGDATLGELRTLFREQQYSRMPVYRDNLDNIVGFVFVKDLIGAAARRRAADDAADAAGALRARDQARVGAAEGISAAAVQMAIVVDEYGGTAGLVTVEDLLEEIVGEIRDEYDVESEPVIDEGDGTFVFSGKVHVDEMADRLGSTIEGEGFETVGGFLLSHLGRVPDVGETFEIDGLAVEVLEAERRRITRVRVRRRAEPSPSSGGAAGSEEPVSSRSSAGPTPASPRCSTASSARSSPSSPTSRRPRATASSACRTTPRAARSCSSTRPASTSRLHRLNVRMVDTALEAMSEVDVVALVVDASAKPGGGDRFMLDVVARR